MILNRFSQFQKPVASFAELFSKFLLFFLSKTGCMRFTKIMKLSPAIPVTCFQISQKFFEPVWSKSNFFVPASLILIFEFLIITEIFFQSLNMFSGNYAA